MIRILKLSGLAALLACLCHGLIFEGAPSSIEVRLSPGSDNVIIWTPGASSDYVFYLCYDIKALPREVVDNFLNWKQPPITSWKALLSAADGSEVLLSEDTLRLEPGLRSGDVMRFRIGHCEIKRPGRIVIRLTPEEQPPFGGITPSLSVRPNELFLMSLRTTRLIWRGANIASIGFVVVLFIDWVSGNRRRNVNFPTPTIARGTLNEIDGQ